MTDEVESTGNGFKMLVDLADVVAANGLTVYRCRYDFLSFGSWVLEAGTPHRRLQIVLDGTESLLRVSSARVMNVTSPPLWEEQEVVPVDSSDAAGAGRQAAQLLQKHATSLGLDNTAAPKPLG